MTVAHVHRKLRCLGPEFALRRKGLALNPAPYHENLSAMTSAPGVSILRFHGFPRIVRLEYGVAHALHGSLGGLARLVRSGIEDIPNLLRMCFKFFAACLNWLDPFDEVIGHLVFAFHATDAGGAAALVGPGDRLAGRE